jgi:hypothetical protein
LEFARAFSISADSLRVSKPGALSMLRITPADSEVSPPSIAMPASPRIGATPNSHGDIADGDDPGTATR